MGAPYDKHCCDCDDKEAEITSLRRELEEVQMHTIQFAKAVEEVANDKKRLVRELDVALHGEAGAAKQASLCDLIGPAQKMAATLKLRTEALEYYLKYNNDSRNGGLITTKIKAALQGGVS